MRFVGSDSTISNHESVTESATRSGSVRSALVLDTFRGGVAYAGPFNSALAATPSSPQAALINARYEMMSVYETSTFRALQTR